MSVNGGIILADVPRIGSQLAAYDPRDSERLRIEHKFRPLLEEDPRLGRLVSYAENKSVPFLRLYRYKEAFAFSFVRSFIRRFHLTHDDYIFDPFAGMGTTTFASMICGIPSIGIDKLPIAVFIARALLHLPFIESGDLTSIFKELQKKLDNVNPAPVAMDVNIMKSAFDKRILFRLRQWKAVIDKLPRSWREIFLLFLFSILEATSYTSKEGQFLRLKNDKSPAYPDEAISCIVSQAEEDINHIDGENWLFQHWMPNRELLPEVILGDARDLRDIGFARSPTAIITSPPYPNRYDYSRNYCLELCFDSVADFEELKSIRHSMLRSHIESIVSDRDVPPHPAVREVLESLAGKKLNNPGIPRMLIGYFVDMKKVIREWNRVLAPEARVAMVIGNVRFEGEMIPVDLILSEMAEQEGFEVEQIVVCRYKGNSSQQMRKYGKAPVRESVVIWRK